MTIRRARPGIGRLSTVPARLPRKCRPFPLQPAAAFHLTWRPRCRASHALRTRKRCANPPIPVRRCHEHVQDHRHSRTEAGRPIAARHLLPARRHDGRARAPPGSPRGAREEARTSSNGASTISEDIADTQELVAQGRAGPAPDIGRQAPHLHATLDARGRPAATGLDTADVVRLYDSLAAAGLTDFLDFEMGNEPSSVRKVLDTAHRHDVRVILSYHNFKRTPKAALLRERFLKADRLGADVAKVAVQCRCDRFDVLTAAPRHRTGGRENRAFPSSACPWDRWAPSRAWWAASSARR